jgi:hypothetical protein
LIVVASHLPATGFVFMRGGVLFWKGFSHLLISLARKILPGRLSGSCPKVEGILPQSRVHSEMTQNDHRGLKIFKFRIILDL